MLLSNVFLNTVPRLPATEIEEQCYEDMFIGCSAIKNAPELPATTLAKNCYRSMFAGCASLVVAPELPATILEKNCYYGMFGGCTSLVTAPNLPATTLAEGCYGSMFYDCVSLVAAPNLPATELSMGCYEYMFTGCFSLNYVRMQAIDIATKYDLFCWLDNVASIGVFEKNASAIWDNEGVVPLGWEVKNVTSSNLSIINKEAYKQKIYSVDGRNNDKMLKGINIVKENNCITQIVYIDE